MADVAALLVEAVADVDALVVEALLDGAGAAVCVEAVVEDTVVARPAVDGAPVLVASDADGAADGAAVDDARAGPALRWWCRDRRGGGVDERPGVLLAELRLTVSRRLEAPGVARKATTRRTARARRVVALRSPAA